MFLTTQHLEGADVVADRAGIINQGEIVAENTPTRLKAELGFRTVEIRPPNPDTLDAMSSALAGFTVPARNQTGTLTVPLPEGDRQLQVRQPTLDDVSWPSRRRWRLGYF